MSLPTFSFETTAYEVADALSSQIAGKNVLVTGTSLQGIGFDTACSIAKHAGLVVITGYNAERLDLSAAAIHKAVPTANVPEVNAYPEPLHVLIHNAADTSGMYTITDDDIERQIAVAHFGPFLLTKLLLPKLLSSTSPTWLPRVVIVASEAHTFGPGIDFAHLRKPLPGSKQETEGFLRYHEVKVANIFLHPGVIYTGAFTKEAVIPALKIVGTLTEDGKPAPNHPWKTLAQGAATTVAAAFDPRLDGQSGAYLVDSNEANNLRTAPASDQANVDKLWKMTEEILGEDFGL
ncbi:Short-chain dehydrogenase/reductase family protein [Mycena chlorophos]|uniref:Short-chain dehydrogenase/reductase family protein n=1 Tax=Mycena chlorophos TaxID=658473 RepID=A0A8H6WLE0_MYCCL|nr:Short-chain dehydrogenase/reductase family protein [Mycena chlorophos]